MISQSTKGILTLIGTFILHFILGTLHTWPSISRYFHSYLVELNQTRFSLGYLDIVFSLVNAVHSICVPFGVILSKTYGPSIIIGIGLTLKLIANALFILTPDIVIVTISLVVCSSGVGLAYMPGIIEIWKYFPNNKGIASGTAFAGFGFTRLLFKYVSIYMINPTEELPLPKRERYDTHINNNFLIYLKKSEIFFSLLSVLCILLIFPFEKNIQDDYKMIKKNNSMKNRNDINENSISNDELNRGVSYDKNEKIISREETDYNEKTIENDSDSELSFFEGDHKIPLRSLIISYPFLQLTFIFFFTMFFGSIELSSMKKFGLMNGHSEDFLWYSALIWKVSNIVCYTLWGGLLDLIKFKKLYMIILSSEILISATCYFISSSKIGFLLYSTISAAVNSANIAVAPTSFVMIFGIEKGALLFSISSLLHNTFYILRPLITNFAASKVYFLMFYLIICLFSMLASIILCFFVEKQYEYKKEEIKDIELEDIKENE